MLFSGLAILVSSLSVAAQDYGGYGGGGGSTPTTTPSSAAVAAPSAPANDATHFNVNVAPGGVFKFDPAEITAPVNSTVTFWFPNTPQVPHSVTQSSFDAPCTHLAASANTSEGFDSGFTVAKQFSIVITDASKPIWFHCKQFQHCGMGMVGSINAPQNGTTTFAAYLAAASKIGLSEPQVRSLDRVKLASKFLPSRKPTPEQSPAASTPSPPVLQLRQRVVLRPPHHPARG
ncbi:hypothetical protein DFH08DRAFT_145266 [Mycena albidolilacea]|uniref:Blue (type 1) copper domain-containing protein n=1 Tax=Mycena albidolilacea TaxID=1033008 RepID=A0AAD7A5R3_9AGAR|nr:hypothetical protein DFH08DRAFT_145266 [Mycena albidolilacea]